MTQLTKSTKGEGSTHCFTPAGGGQRGRRAVGWAGRQAGEGVRERPAWFRQFGGCVAGARNHCRSSRCQHQQCQAVQLTPGRQLCLGCHHQQLVQAGEGLDERLAGAPLQPRLRQQHCRAGQGTWPGQGRWADQGKGRSGGGAHREQQAGNSSSSTAAAATCQPLYPPPPPRAPPFTHPSLAPRG